MDEHGYQTGCGVLSEPEDHALETRAGARSCPLPPEALDLDGEKPERRLLAWYESRRRGRCVGLDKLRGELGEFRDQCTRNILNLCECIRILNDSVKYLHEQCDTQQEWIRRLFEWISLLEADIDARGLLAGTDIVGGTPESKYDELLC